MPQQQPPLLEVKNLSVSFFSYDPKHPALKKALEAKAVDNMSFSLQAGKTLCLVGESGCGKTMTAYAVMGLVPEPGIISQGEVNFMGQNLRDLPEKELQKIRGNRMSMIFQEPMTALNPVLSVGSQIEEVLLAHQKLNKSDVRARVIELLGKVGIPAPAERYRDYPHQMSGGMRQRIIIAMALACNPSLIIADEPTTALDVTIQRQILDLLADLGKELGTATLLITHDLGVVKEVADQIIVMYAGKIMEKGNAQQIFNTPLHPYTIGLIASCPRLPTPKEIKAGLEPDQANAENSATPARKKPGRRLPTIPGVVPSLWARPQGCPFNTRCSKAFEPCFKTLPSLIAPSANKPDHLVRCWLHEKQIE